MRKRVTMDSTSSLASGGRRKRVRSAEWGVGSGETGGGRNRRTYRVADKPKFYFCSFFLLVWGRGGYILVL